jgi:hypothetical protein
MNQMYTRPRVKTYMKNHHKKVWARSKFNEACKVDYVNNNLAVFQLMDQENQVASFGGYVEQN